MWGEGWEERGSIHLHSSPILSIYLFMYVCLCECVCVCVYLRVQVWAPRQEYIVNSTLLALPLLARKYFRLLSCFVSATQAAFWSSRPLDLPFNLNCSCVLSRLQTSNKVIKLPRRSSEFSLAKKKKKNIFPDISGAQK